jgi:hypothetical protein
MSVFVQLRSNLVAVTLKAFLLVALMCTLIACASGPEEQGPARVIAAQVVGVYELGPERLELKSDGTYIQDITSTTAPIHHTGYWEMMNHFIDPSEVLLIDAVILGSSGSAGKPSMPLFGDLQMYVLIRSGKIALARCETGERYYQRLP